MLETNIGRILFSPEELQTKIAELGKQLTNDYQGKNLLVLGILKGAAVFMADLIREIKLPLQYDFMAVSSYGASTQSSGAVRIIKDVDRSVEGVHILIVEDIVDTGLTLKYLKENLASRNPLSVKVVALLDKPSRRLNEIVPDYSGFTIADEFVVGFGLDFNEQYRNLPYIGVYQPAEA